MFNKVIAIFSSFTILSCAYAQELTLSGEHEVGMRTRFQQNNEHVANKASALTTRLVLQSTFTLDEDEEWLVTIQPNAVFTWHDDYSSVANNNEHAIIPDPDGLSLTRANIRYQNNEDISLTLGRQPLSFDNERFVGSDDFWQTPQTFNAIKFDYNDELNWHFQWAYTDRVQRIFGRDSKVTLPIDDPRYSEENPFRPSYELGQQALHSNLFNLAYKSEGGSKFVAYSYWINNPLKHVQSSKTLGLRITDEFKPKLIKYFYTAEYALQKDAYDNPVDYQTWYSLFELKAQYKSHSLQLGLENKADDALENGRSFSFHMPLGSKHKFLGWVDAFYGGSDYNSFRDLYISYQGRKNKLRWKAVAHSFENYRTKEQLGYELNLELAYRYSRKWEFKSVFGKFYSDKGLPRAENTQSNMTSWFVSAAYNI